MLEQYEWLMVVALYCRSANFRLEQQMKTADSRSKCCEWIKVNMSIQWKQHKGNVINAALVVNNMENAESQ